MLPRQCSKQRNRSNFCNTAMEEYYRLSIFIPYLDSLISSLQIRFSPENRFTFSLCALHPSYLLHHTKEEYFNEIDQICKHYKIDNFKLDAATWFELGSKRLQERSTTPEGLESLLNDTELFPSIRQAILIALTLPVTTCTVERSFSTMKRVKTWLRSTMSDSRLSGLCMKSAHRMMVSENKNEIIQKVISKFGL